MNDPQERLMELFHEGRARPAGAERDAFLAAACGPDATLLEQVTRLIEAHSQAGDFLQQPVALPPAEPGDDTAEPGDDTVGAVIGSYRLLEEIGEGCFGRVFRAEQTEPVHRCVALKVIKAGMDTREVVARFEAERQALALMDHPHIAKVFEAGATAAGRPYFVMELVDGLPITKFCDQHRLPTADRLALFIKVCHAVQHAHQKGVIHRDLKPSNIIVAQIDGEAEPKIIDFGVAKALGPKLTECTVLTAVRQIIGTPGYMSPEQADPQDGDIDTRCDIYSLGVLLYELLTGVTPFDTVQLHLAAVDEIRRIIRETDPPKPSTRLRELGVQLGVVARHRRTEPAALTRSIHGDLDWIVMKALEKDRTRRYQTISALAEDLRHHLAHEPVAAGPPGRLYRLGKFARRHRFGTAMAAAALVAALASLATLAIGLHQAKQERDRAVAAEARAAAEAKRAMAAAARASDMASNSAAANDFLLSDLLVQATPKQPPDPEVKLRTLVDRAADAVGWRLHQQPQLELATRLSLVKVYRGLGEIKNARFQLERLKEICREQGLVANDPRWKAVREQEWLVLLDEGRLGDAERLLEERLEVLRRTLGPDHPDTLNTIYNLASCLHAQDKPEEARKLYEEILPVRRRVQGPEHPDTLCTIHNLATACEDLGKQDEALRLYEEILPVRRRVQGDAHPDTVRAMRNMAGIYQQQGRADKMAGIYGMLSAVEARSPGHDQGDMVANVQTLAMLAGALADWPRAAEYWQKRIALADNIFLVHRAAALAALMAGDLDSYAKECQTLLAWVERGANGADGEAAAETSLTAPHPAIDLAVCARLAGQALQRKPKGNWTRLAKGMAEYRAGDIEAAHRRFQALASDREASVALTARCFLAMSHHRLGNDEAAKRALADANRSLDPILRRGALFGGELGWTNSAATLAVRAEAERAVFGREVSPKVDMAGLAAARAAWRPAKDPLWAGRKAALAGEWQESAAAFENALAEPGFDWQAADFELPDFCNWLGVAFARGGDQAGQSDLSRRLAAMATQAPNPGDRPLRAAKVCVLPANCPPEMLELSHRLLNQFNADPAAKVRPDWTGLHWALLEYRRGNHAQALDSARAAEKHSNLSCRATATLLHAMAAKRLGRDEEFHANFQQATALAAQLAKTSESNWEMANVLVFQLLFDEAEAMLEPAVP